MTYSFVNKFKSIKPLRDHVLVSEMNFEGRQLSSGIYLLNDDGKTDGIRPRWAQVFAVGPEQTDIKVGQWILVEHGRWTRGSSVEIDGKPMTIRRIDYNSIMMISDEAPGFDDNISTAVHASRKTREVYE
jgi:co-chaperonin GroES (HSP10)